MQAATDMNTSNDAPFWEMKGKSVINERFTVDPPEFELGIRQTANDILYKSATSSQLDETTFTSLLQKQPTVLAANSTVFTSKPASIMPLKIPKQVMELACGAAHEIVNQRDIYECPALLLDLASITRGCEDALPFVVDSSTCAIHVQVTLQYCFDRLMVLIQFLLLFADGILVIQCPSRFDQRQQDGG